MSLYNTPWYTVYFCSRKLSLKFTVGNLNLYCLLKIYFKHRVPQSIAHKIGREPLLSRLYRAYICHRTRYSKLLGPIQSYIKLRVPVWSDVYMLSTRVVTAKSRWNLFNDICFIKWLPIENKYEKIIWIWFISNDIAMFLLCMNLIYGAPFHILYFHDVR